MSKIQPSARTNGHVFQIAVRDAKAKDAARIQQIYSFYVENGLSTFEEEAPQTEDILSRWKAVVLLGLPYLVAELDEQIVGYSYASPYRTRSAYRFTVENSVYVADGYTSRGIGGALLAELIRRCEAGGWKQMVAIIGDSNNLASVRLHLRLGFTNVGTLKGVGFKFERWVDTVLMQRGLGEAS